MDGQPAASTLADSSGAIARLAQSVTHYRWVICALLFFATTINYVDRQIIGLLKQTLQGQLGWNEIDYSTKNVDKTWKSVRENRRKHGWEDVEKIKDVPSFHQPTTIRNKYFEVAHRALN